MSSGSEFQASTNQLQAFDDIETRPWCFKFVATASYDYIGES